MTYVDSIHRLLRQVILTELGLRAALESSEGDLTAYAAHAIADVCEVPLVGVFESDGDGLRLKTGVGWPPDYRGKVVLCGSDPHTGAVLGTADPVGLQDIPVSLDALGVVDGRSVRLGDSEAPLGVLGAYAHAPGTFDDEVVAFLKAVALVLAGALARARADRALREGAARIKAIMDSAAEGILTVHDDGTVESCNPAAGRLFGIPMDEAIGLPVTRFLPELPEDLTLAERGPAQPLDNGNAETTGRRRDGTSFPVVCSVHEVAGVERPLFTCLVRDITEQRELENEVLRIADQERRRIGEDLHDGLGQLLTGITLLAQNVAQKVARGELPSVEQTEEVVTLLRQADAYARGLARGLVPVDLEAEGLRAALERLAANAAHFFDVDCVVELAGEPPARVPDAVPVHLFRIAQEAVSNAVRHGRAEHITIKLAYAPAWVRLRVVDDGRGYPGRSPLIDAARPPARSPDEERPLNRGMGVRIMRHRAHVMGGHFEIRRRARRGTAVTCTVPLATDSPTSTPTDP